MNNATYRSLPPVHAVLEDPGLIGALRAHGRAACLRAVRRALDEVRQALARGGSSAPDIAGVAQCASAILAAERPALRPVINATGILLHTGLGRAPLAAEAADAVARVARGYCNLELDLETGDRGSRTSGVSRLLERLTGAEAATVVNNNAAATMLALRALAAGREVIVSRGQLIEIGGSFRLPEIFEASGARLREVGTTNRTRLADYERAIGPETAAILRVHPSNFRIVGFTEQVPIRDLVPLARSRGLWCIDDIGSGALTSERPTQAAGEPTVAEGLAAGADLVLFSGDKLLGGPQCGIVAGSRSAVERVARDPMMRAVRVDKMTLAALEMTLHLAADLERGRAAIPLWRFLDTPLERLRARAVAIAEELNRTGQVHASVQDSESFLGGGSMPAQPVPSVAVRVDPPFPGGTPSEGAFAHALRVGEPGVVARVQTGAVWFDPRSMPEEADATLLEAVRKLL